MTPRKLKTLETQVKALRQSQAKAFDLQAIARKLGRKPVKRGKEPTWESQAFPNLRPIAIPDHGGRDLSHGVKNSILTQLSDDIAEWQMILDTNADGGSR